MNLRRAMRGTLEALTLAVEAKDPYSSGHQRRVADLARTIAMEMGLPDTELDGIRMAAFLHDIGKISLPAEILSKASRLSEVEFSLIKTHPQNGYDILKEIEFPWPVARMVWQHHERLDGSGYPLGISGEEILLGARILAVADVVEAMASDRSYRPTPGLEKALEEIGAQRESFMIRCGRCLPSYLQGKGLPSGIGEKEKTKGKWDVDPLLGCEGINCGFGRRVPAVRRGYSLHGNPEQGTTQIVIIDAGTGIRRLGNQAHRRVTP